MKNSLFSCVVAASFCFASSAFALDTEREGCHFSGKKLDPSIAKATTAAVPKVSETFTGSVICYSEPEGRKDEEFRLVKGLREGEYRKYDNTGNIEEITAYRAGKRHGHYERYDHRTHKLQIEGEHVDDQPVGVQRSYNTTKGFLERAYWRLADGGTDTDIQFNEKGQPITLTCGTNSVVAQDDQWCGRAGKGRVEIFDTEGKLSRVEEYKLGKLDGQVIEYGPEETVKVTSYVAGESKGTIEKKKGQVTFARIDGEPGKESAERVFFPGTTKLRSERTWKDKNLISEKLYWENGKLKQEKVSKGPGVYDIKEYRENGTLAEEGQYQAVFGVWSSYMRPKGTVKNYDSDGALYAEYNYLNGEQDGEQRYFSDKKLQRREMFKAGDLLWAEEFDEQERLIRKAEFNSDGSLKKETITKNPVKI